MVHGGGETRDDVAVPRSRVAVAAGIAGGLVAIGFGAAWIERAPLVAHFVDRALAERHVPGRYRIAAIGPVQQRLEDVSIGDPAAPDLTARVLELRLGYGVGGPYLAGVRAEGVRLAARVIDGRLSLGSLDRLMSGGQSGKPLALPDLDVVAEDAQVRLATPAGLIRATIAGAGKLSDGFHGTLNATSDRLALAGCALSRPSADIVVRIAARRPVVTGPLTLAALDCASGLRLGAGRADVALRLADTLDRWTGGVSPTGFAGRAPGLGFGALSGMVTLAGDRLRTEGRVKLASAGIATAQGVAAGARGDGRYRYAPGVSGLVFAGDLGIDGAKATPAFRARIASAADALAATPLGPVASAAAHAGAALLADADVAATGALTAGGPAGLAATLRRLMVAGRSGGRMRIDEGAGIGWSVRDHGWRVDGRLASSGGGLPAFAATFAQPRAGAPVTGRATMLPYAAGGSRLALAPVSVAAADGATRIVTVATIDGPLGGGRIEGLSVPIDARVDRRGFAFGAHCLPIGFTRLAVSGVVLGASRAQACGIAGAPIATRIGNGPVRAGVDVTGLRLAGRSGAAPLTLAADTIRIGMDGFAAGGLAVRLGTDDAPTRLDMATIDGRFAGGLAGAFTGAAGRIGAVPLALSGAAGDWSVAGGALTLHAGLTVADAATPARFKPLAGRDVTLRLAGGRIAASGILAEPRTGAKLADIALTHDLASARGGATLAVPGLVFDKQLQPDMLTPSTLGVIANVAGTVTGRGRIDWTAQGVTSGGDFATDRIDLAAAFGPVTGIKGRIHFSDLLALATPPHQRATVAEINPGIAVINGVFDYQLLAGQRVAVEGARWPFAGGTLTLDPTMLAFDQQAERHMTLRLATLDGATFVQQFDLPNLSATGTFDGVLPMIFDQTGGRITGGRIVARAPGGTLAYVGALSNADVGTMSRLAFDALKAIRYSSLSIGLDGRLDGEIVSHVGFQGIRDATPDAGMVARMIHNLPFRFNIAVRAPFRALLGTARSYVDPSLLLASGLPTTRDTVSTAPVPVQPHESEPMR